MEWNAEQYEKFRKERTLPSYDLVNAIECGKINRIVDIGCGIGNSTAVLREKFPNAEITGVDSSEEMLIMARKSNPDTEFIRLDAGSELNRLDGKFDIVFSNACIQWIPNHVQLLRNLMELLNDSGTLAVQIPKQEFPFKSIIKEVVNSEKWCSKINDSDAIRILTEEEYFDILAEISGDFRIWETTYFHAMPSHRSLVEWFKGTGLRPYLEQLSDEDKADFEEDILHKAEKSYPVQKNGEIIFRFPRLFFMAVR